MNANACQVVDERKRLDCILVQHEPKVEVRDLAKMVVERQLLIVIGHERVMGHLAVEVDQNRILSDESQRGLKLVTYLLSRRVQDGWQNVHRSVQ